MLLLLRSKCFPLIKGVEYIYKIYKYTNIHNNKVYIGQTKQTLDQRSGLNGINYKESCKFYNAICKYGWDSFIVELLEDDVFENDANDLEEYYIKLYDSTNDNYGYNMQTGGNHFKINDDSKKILSEKAKIRLQDKSNNPMYGKKHKNSSLEKMSRCKTGSNNPMFNTKWNDNQRNAKRKGYCYEWTEERRQQAGKRLAETVSKKVRCIEDYIEFDTVSEAANYYNVSISTLSGHLHNYQKTCCGKHFEFI